MQFRCGSCLGSGPPEPGEGTALARGQPWKSGWPVSLGVCRVWGPHRMSGLLYPALIVSAQLRGGLTSSLHTQSPHHPEFLIILRTLARIPNRDTGVGVGGHASCRGSSPSSTDRPPCGARVSPASGTFAALPLVPGRPLVPCFPFSRRSTGSTDWVVGTWMGGPCRRDRRVWQAGLRPAWGHVALRPQRRGLLLSRAPTRPPYWALSSGPGILPSVLAHGVRASRHSAVGCHLCRLFLNPNFSSTGHPALIWPWF